ncbi:MAG TPA: Hsp20/alpha crystallin family protein [Phycisphaerae bacterium]|nr:Hsp20/alpha crystallin family protein [Phycisphaerales bacterium]HRX83420.1 Hsp20/alpha crystallin family protein [Phycisphaerae bacterium]
MSLIPWRKKHEQADILPAPALSSLRSEFDQLFDRFFGEFESGFPAGTEGMGAWLPAFEVSETGDAVTVKAELPGVDPQDVDVTVSGNILTISGEKREESEKREGVTYRCERRFGRFQRSIELPTAVDADNVTAENANGVLTVRLPRSESARPRKVKVLAPK